MYVEYSNSLQIITELHSRSQLKSYFLSRVPDKNRQCVGFCVPFISAYSFMGAGSGLSTLVELLFAVKFDSQFLKDHKFNCCVSSLQNFIWPSFCFLPSRPLWS